MVIRQDGGAPWETKVRRIRKRVRNSTLKSRNKRKSRSRRRLRNEALDMRPATGMLTLESGHQIHYERIESDPEKPCLVFLHEGLGCTAMWGEFPRMLCERTGCPGLSYDRLGYGKSSALRKARTVHYMHEAALQELPQVLERLLPNRPYVLVGHSDGGSIALIHGAERPRLLKGIITEAAHAFVEPETISGIRAADDAFDAGKLGGLTKYHGGKTAGVFKAWSQTWLSSWFSHWNLEYLLPSIDCPLLVIQGRDDQYGTEAQVASIVSTVGGATRPLLLDDCGHSPHSELPRQVVDAMSDFIRHDVLAGI